MYAITNLNLRLAYMSKIRFLDVTFHIISWTLDIEELCSVAQDLVKKKKSLSQNRESNRITRHCAYRQNHFYDTIPNRNLIILIKGTKYSFRRGNLNNLPASGAHLDAPSDWKPGGCGFNPHEVGNILS